MTLLELQNIRKTFTVRKGFMGGKKAFVHAVNDVSLSIQEGENIGLVGESGSGKSTLARIALKLMPATEGQLLFGGQDVTHLKGDSLKHFRKDVQMVFQDPYSSLDPRYTIGTIIREAMTLSPELLSSKQKSDELIYKLLGAVNLKEHMISRYPHEFSGGERQRIAIARSLVLNPRLLVLDEAVSSLDVIVQEQIINLLKELQSQYNLTYLFISHNLKVIRKLCQRIAVMYKGKIVESASADEIFNHPIHPYTQELLSAAVEYRSSQREEDFEIPDNARLVDQGNGHLVLES